jgi:SAM-dependent methyltransferase
MPDAHFALPRLAEIYDEIDGDRSDLDHYVAIVGEYGARSVLDVGCGTGTLACRLALAGLAVVGVDPALASLDVARRKPGAELVHWNHGTTDSLPPLKVDMAVMTGNVAQVFLTDSDWNRTLAAIRWAMHRSGTLVFETRDPDRCGWEDWTTSQTRQTYDIARVGRVEYSVDVTDVSLPLVSFQSTYRFERCGEVLTSESTLRFRTEDEVRESLTANGFVVQAVRDAPDRPGKELVFIAAPGSIEAGCRRIPETEEELEQARVATIAMIEAEPW